MPSRRIIVCLANSRKHLGRCVAGKELVDGGPGPWIRPVSNRPMAELSQAERSYPFWKEPRVLDLIELEVESLSLHHLAYQTENHRIVSRARWRRTGRWTWANLPPFLDAPENLWSNGNSSSNGLNDRVLLADAALMDHSLLLIRPQALRMEIGSEGREFRRRKLRARFGYRGIEYRLAVTDPLAEAIFERRPDGKYRVSDASICVSLGEPHTDNFCYKLVAAVITPNGF